jgi:hypothetical protein
VVDFFREPVNAIAVGGYVVVLYDLTTDFEEYGDVDLYVGRVWVGNTP